MEIVIIWIMIAGLTAFVAGQKGHSVIVWLIIGGLLGVFGLIAAFAVRPIEKNGG